MPAVEPRLVDDADEELRAAAVGLAGDHHRGDGPPRVPLRVELGRDEAQAAAAVHVPAGRILRQRVAALHDPVPHHAVEDRAVVLPRLGQRDEQPDVVRCVLGQQVDDDGAEVRLEHALPAGHLLDRQRRDVRIAVLGDETGRRDEPHQQRQRFTEFHKLTSR